jgi:uncharacterized protein
MNGRPFLYDGHKGIFYDSLPAHAVKALDALAQPAADLSAAPRSPRKSCGGNGGGVLREIQMYQNGTHPNLAPESRQESLPPRSPNTFNVFVSQACNLSCRYCINQRGTFGKRSSIMSRETAREFLAFIEKTISSGIHPSVHVLLFGGEPLLARDTVYTLARGLQDFNRQKLKTKVHIVLSTNGTIYDGAVFKILAEQPDCNTVVVSLDGFKEIHDANRPFSNPAQGSTYDTVVKNLRRMVRAHVACSVICVVPYPYDYIGAAEELRRLGIRRFEIKQLIPHVFGRPDLPEVFNDDFALWKKNYLAYSDYCLEQLNGRRPVRHVDRGALFRDYAKALWGFKERPGTLACGLADVKVGVTSDGRLLPCESFCGHPEFELGNVRTGFDPAKYRKFDEWILSGGQFRIDNERCRNCYAKLVCGGGCYAVSYDKTGRLSPFPESWCEYVRERVKIDLYSISRMKKEHPELVPGSANRSS